MPLCRVTDACLVLQKLLHALNPPPCNQKPSQVATVFLGPRSNRHPKEYLISFICCLACTVQAKSWAASQGLSLLSSCSGLCDPQPTLSSVLCHRHGAVMRHHVCTAGAPYSVHVPIGLSTSGWRDDLEGDSRHAILNS